MRQRPETKETYIQSSIEYNENGEPVKLSFDDSGKYDSFYEYSAEGSLIRYRDSDNELLFGPIHLDKNGDITE